MYILDRVLRLDLGNEWRSRFYATYVFTAVRKSIPCQLFLQLQNRE